MHVPRIVVVAASSDEGLACATAAESCVDIPRDCESQVDSCGDSNAQGARGNRQREGDRRQNRGTGSGGRLRDVEDGLVLLYEDNKSD